MQKRVNMLTEVDYIADTRIQRETQRKREKYPQIKRSGHKAIIHGTKEKKTTNLCVGSNRIKQGKVSLWERKKLLKSRATVKRYKASKYVSRRQKKTFQEYLISRRKTFCFLYEDNDEIECLKTRLRAVPGKPRGLA